MLSLQVVVVVAAFKNCSKSFSLTERWFSSVGWPVVTRQKKVSPL